VTASIRNCEIADLCPLPDFQLQTQQTCFLPNAGQRCSSFGQDEGSTPMDAEARRRQLVATINRVAGGDRAALRLVYSETSAKLLAFVSVNCGGTKPD
jgi:hypothetical protein